MAQNVSSSFREAMLADIEGEMQAMRNAIARQFIPGGEPVKLTRIQRAHNRLHWRIRGARTALGKRIAPWLDEGYY